MSLNEMQAYIVDAANHLEDEQLLRTLYLRAANLMALAEKKKTAGGQAAERRLTHEIPQRHCLGKLLSASNLRPHRRGSWG